MNDTRAYGNGSAYGDCVTGLQFAAAHLEDGTWPEGYGYYVGALGELRAAEKPAGGCVKVADAAQCAAAGCEWVSKSGKSYGWEGSGGKGPCEGNTEAAACAAEEGCAWWAPKAACYKPAAVDPKAGFDGSKVAKPSTEAPSWAIVDTVFAPNKTGDYILQWRWDNEQTPQIWTTCADVRVCEGCAPTADSDSATAGTAAWSLVAPAALLWSMRG